MKRAHIILTGRVQGVFFRDGTKNKARALGLKGWVRNVDSDKVEVMAEGEEDKLRELVEYCKKGPDAAEVSDIEIEYSDASGGFEGFSVRY